MVDPPWDKLAPLWEEASMSSVLEAFTSVPLQPNFETSDYIIESRLVKGNDIIDYSVKMHPQDFKPYSSNPAVQEWAARSKQWHDCVSFMESFATTGYHNELWMEFDQTTGVSMPSVFVSPLNWMRTFLMASEWKKVVDAVVELDAG